MNWNRSERALFALAVAGTAFWAIASMTYPMGYDQGIMASVGDVIVRGGMPYRDGFDLKGPVTFYLFALVQVFFGRVMWGIRLFDLGLLITSAMCLYSVLKRMQVPGAICRWLALGLVLAAASRSWFHVSQPDGWAAAFIMIAIYLSMTRPLSKLIWLASGALIGASTLIKPFFILFLAVPIALGMSEGLMAMMVPAVLSVAGATLPVLVTLAWFAWKGAFADLVAVQVGANLFAFPEVGFRGIIENIASYMWNGGPRTPSGPFGVLIIPIVGGIALAWRERRKVGLGLLLWLAIAIACVAVQRRFFVYHWLVAFPPLLAVAGLSLSRLSAQASTRLFAPVALGLFIAGVAIRPAWDTLFFARYAIGLESREQYLTRFSRFEYRAAAAVKAASYIKTHTQPDEKVAVFGVDAIVQYLSERAAPTRFVFSFPLNAAKQSYRERYRAEFISDLRRTPPRYIVLGSSQDEDTTSSSFPELSELLLQSYESEKKIGQLELYRLRDRVGLLKAATPAVLQ